MQCLTCKKDYEFSPQELDFYQDQRLPLPRKCFDCRHLDRVKRRGPWKPTKRTCNKCSNDILAFIESDYSGQVYCEKCYQKEIY